jgi:biopolymer transport protein ExbD
MAMQVGNEGGDDEVMMDMNTTPLIDVMLVLLILLIVTLPIQTHAVKLDMPRATPQQPTTPPVVVDLKSTSTGRSSGMAAPLPTVPP